MLSPVTAYNERSRIWRWWKTSNQEHMAVTFLVSRKKEFLVWREKKPKALPGYRGGKRPGRSNVEEGRGRRGRGPEKEDRERGDE